MDQSLASRIEAANSALMVDGNIDAVGEFFTPDYVAHLTDQEMSECCRWSAAGVLQVR
jgi:hypothetical protein